MSFLSLVNPAGGIRYHLRARRFARSLWQPFRWALGEVLLDWKPAAETLILVGPSAGYCFQPFVLERFERVVCLEPDPIARYLFSRKIRQASLARRPRIEFIETDHLVAAPERLVQLADSLGSCALLFSNVLGQLRALLEVEDLDAPALVRVRLALKEALFKRPYLSFHDRVSGALRPTFSQPLHCDFRLSDLELVRQLYGRMGRKSDALGGGEGTLLDHLTEGLFPAETPHTYLTWQLEPERYHLIECVCSDR